MSIGVDFALSLGIAINMVRCVFPVFPSAILIKFRAGISGFSGSSLLVWYSSILDVVQEHANECCLSKM